MKNFSMAISLIVTTMLLSACFGEDEQSVEQPNSSSELSSSNSSYVEDLIADGCHPDIAKALGPFESEYGECSMPTYIDICGEDNFKAGIELIDDAREVNPGLNPWTWACARTEEPEIAMVASCQYRFRASKAQCECAANASFEQEEDKELVEWLVFTEANDPMMNEGRFEGWLTLTSESNRVEDLRPVRARYYDRFQNCSS